MKLKIFTDGGARGNPGPAAAGIVIYNLTDGKEKIVQKIGKSIGETTNNVAEYFGVILALEEIKKINKINKKIDCDFFLDSTLVVNQLNGTFKVKDRNLKQLFMKVRIGESEANASCRYNYIPREENRDADFLVNQALDNILCR